MQIALIIVLLLLSAFFSSAETALTAVSSIKLRALADEGSRGAKKVLRLTENKSKLLSTILVGNNVVNLTASALVTNFCTEQFGNHYIGYATGILTLLVLIFGEISPKTLATVYSVQFAIFAVYPISWLMVILTPLVWVLDGITRLILLIFGVKHGEHEETVTESELLTMVNVSHEEGVIEPEEKFMISNVVDFGDALSKDIMIPRADIVSADVNSDYETITRLLIEETFSRIPIYEETKDNIIGILYLKDLFIWSQTGSPEEFDLRKILRKPLFVYEYQRTAQIFADMKLSSVSMAVVLDEYGVTSGIITMEDLIEEIVGEIRDEYDEDEEKFIVRMDDNTYDIDASIKLDDLNDALSLDLSSDHYDSLAGYVIQLMDKLPAEGEEADNGRLHFLVKGVEKNRIERVVLTMLPNEEENTEEVS